MIIKGLFRRYERWNPVHPTLGTFWGMGIGVGCGVGWGPGFGPEVIGYVGAGCGVGFSVGITFIGIGVGLPQNGLVKTSQRAVAASNIVLESAKALAIAMLNGMLWDSMNFLSPQINSLSKQSCQNLSKLRVNAIEATKRVDFTNLNKALSGSMQSSLECLKAFRNQHWPPPNSK
ncbi:Cadmium-induced protein AS8 [Rhynchospora pubera]|uniref:Cadmium-induced protein AS8 n=1 Tax=Rhynchospora pubera TaxID=906938 RepID=A0AAV8BTJ5_9POAL|nr:Cadmium-induced protein AS8 [Rhynchospora pubera]KAJ4800044.1 Cadmium-induced protein AS8 [Rhynchospora pubera]KAJ4811415.1 Cadmium-induced protein AS8 [Rhynchospora pubera]